MFIIWLIGKKKAGKAQNCEFLPTRVIRGGVEFFRDIRVPADILVCPMHLARTLALLVALASSASAAGVEFNRDIRPILSNKCFACHGPDAKAREAKLRLDQRESALAVIEPGSPEKSELIARVTHTDRDEVMPPVETHKSITAGELEKLKAWITAGAEYQAHWAFIPPQRPAVPEGADPIDHLIGERLDEEGLRPSPPAPLHTLIRRVSLDLTGLPPRPEEVEEFVSDESPGAYALLVDRLLASPRYGEHMAVGWMEASRYADTDGYQNDRYRYQWAWRDWLVRALNRNMPFDQFATEQLAGDMLPDATLHQQIATGFCRNHRINSEAGSIAEEWQVEYVADRVDTMGTVFLGLTVACARCHDHKFDPITQRDYYGLFAYFNNVPEFGTGPNNGNSPPFIDVPAGYPEIGKRLDVAVTPAPLAWQKDGNFSAVRRPVPGKEQTVMVMQEMEEPRDTYVLNRGVYNQPDKSQKLQPAIPASLGAGGRDFDKDRLGLAAWLTDAKNPLTARVAVNRYWQHFFGSGIVRTSENFGAQGDPPSHEELLDWLAVEFVASGWDVKAMQRKIVMSATYRQSSETPEALLRADPENRLLARAPRLRLPAFAIRDAALAASGLLVEKLYGRPAKPYMPPKIWIAISNNKYQRDKGDNLYRRSVYTYWRRTIPPPTMMAFNSGDREICTVRQSRTNTPLQALTLMNNIAFVEASRLLAERMVRGGETLEGRVLLGYQFVIGRPPSAAEVARLGADYANYLAEFQKAPSDAKGLLAIGDKPRDASLDPAELAATTMIATTIFNLDETLTRE
ncbi:MAG: PSD1 and planctomycete cytochrome C domain-containing protein [Akkermansiaceae bacterium]|jgi:hypothetical protein